ncbi:MAG TPA: NAD(P)H-dependent glycerol-3-phosphate dehydrogenase, partial [Candidatus Bathyarchaeia archaeon]|nr:NAD(P)H-dependent glycerol-3-phosphate dehydrogenase [Candidatus Bathyarchaeia archaeon]
MIKQNHKPTIAFLGDGSWGTTLAVYVANKGYAATLWGAFKDNINAIVRDGENRKFLPGVTFPDNLTATADLAQAVSQAQIIVLSTPSQYLERVLRQLKDCNHAAWKNKIILSVTKGIETNGLRRVSQLVHDHLGQVRFAVLSGPTIATEVAQGIPSSAVIASKDLRTAKKLQAIFHSSTFRIYTANDVAGVELGGSLKNVIALACGVCDGLGFGTNTKSAILARGLAEMSRLGKAMGSKTKTFAGLTGLGDLVTTCFSPKSRNRSVGEQLGKGKKIEAILSEMVMVAEGVETAKAVQKLAKQYKVDVPIATEVYRIIYSGKRPEKAV